MVEETPQRPSIGPPMTSSRRTPSLTRIRRSFTSTWWMPYAAQQRLTIEADRSHFALIGLYLHVELSLIGRIVQQAHMRLAPRHVTWPAFDPPASGGKMTIFDVVAVAPGAARDRAIDWCASVWQSWASAATGAWSSCCAKWVSSARHLPNGLRSAFARPCPACPARATIRDMNTPTDRRAR